jgi:hypothetical protein
MSGTSTRHGGTDQVAHAFVPTGLAGAGSHPYVATGCAAFGEDSSSAAQGSNACGGRFDGTEDLRRRRMESASARRRQAPHLAQGPSGRRRHHQGHLRHRSDHYRRRKETHSESSRQTLAVSDMRGKARDRKRSLIGRRALLAREPCASRARRPHDPYVMSSLFSHFSKNFLRCRDVPGICRRSRVSKLQKVEITTCTASGSIAMCAAGSAKKCPSRASGGMSSPRRDRSEKAPQAVRGRGDYPEAATSVWPEDLPLRAEAVMASPTVR